MPTKQQFTDAKNRIVSLYRERPIEMLMVTAAVFTGSAKLINSVNETANAVTWRREVTRRTRNDRQNTIH